MPLPPAFEVRRGIYGADEANDEDRCEIWRLLEPFLEDIVRKHLDRSMVFAWLVLTFLATVIYFLPVARLVTAFAD